MFRLDEVLERWATIYKPMQHNPSAAAKVEDKAFFLTDRLADENEFTRNFAKLKKPCVLYCSTIDAQLSKDNHKAVSYQYNFYLLAKQQGANYAQDDQGAANVKVDLNEMMLDLLAWLFEERAKAESDLTLSKDERNGWKGLRLEQTAWWSAPRFKNGWWIIGVEIEGIDPRKLCVNPEKYIDDITK